MDPSENISSERCSHTVGVGTGGLTQSKQNLSNISEIKIAKLSIDVLEKRWMTFTRYSHLEVRGWIGEDLVIRTEKSRKKIGRDLKYINPL
jgi:hypothetical protein